MNLEPNLNWLTDTKTAILTAELGLRKAEVELKKALLLKSIPDTSIVIVTATAKLLNNLVKHTEKIQQVLGEVI
jgi:hypothetical protein